MNDIQELKRQGLPITQISAHTGFDGKTIRKYLQDPKPPRYGPRERRPSKLDPFKAYLDQRLQSGVWNAVVLLRELKDKGYSGGYSILKAYLRPQREAARVVAVRRFETPPGQQAQVDWGDLGAVLCASQRRPLCGFVMTLGSSRAMFADIALDQKLLTFLRLHEAAFATLGGVPAEILYDRAKTVALGTDERGEVVWNSVFYDFARYWGFTPRLCRAYRPQTKGKIESGIRYVRRNFLCGREAASVDDLRGQLCGWMAEVANVRVHGTTYRIVAEAWAAEKPHLQPLMGRVPYPYVDEVTRRVSRDAYVAFRGNRYSVPWTAAGQVVRVCEEAGQVRIIAGPELLAVHRLCADTHQTITVEAHHRGIPLSAGSQHAKKNKIYVVEQVEELTAAGLMVSTVAPLVEVRSLAAYEAFVEGCDGCPPAELVADLVPVLGGVR